MLFKKKYSVVKWAWEALSLQDHALYTFYIKDSEKSCSKEAGLTCYNP